MRQDSSVASGCIEPNQLKNTSTLRNHSACVDYVVRGIHRDAVGTNVNEVTRRKIRYHASVCTGRAPNTIDASRLE